MNLAIPTTRTFKQHTLAAVGGLCIAFAATAGGVIALSQSGGSSSTVATKTDYSWARPVSDDWRTIYYIVPTQEMGDQILTAEAEQQNLILENQGELPHRTLHVILADTPELDQLVASMMAEVSPETTSFVDLRYPPIQAILPVEEAPLSQVAPVLEGVEVPATGSVVAIHQPYPCSEANIADFATDLLAGLCN